VAARRDLGALVQTGTPLPGEGSEWRWERRGVGELARLGAARDERAPLGEVWTTSDGARSGATTTAAAKARPRPLPIRALRVLERLGVVRPDVAPHPRDLKHEVCEAHLLAAKSCGQATVQQIAAWFQEHGQTLAAECATWGDDWLTSRCDQPRR
jgi:hypothetical protein